MIAARKSDIFSSTLVDIVVGSSDLSIEHLNRPVSTQNVTRPTLVSHASVTVLRTYHEEGHETVGLDVEVCHVLLNLSNVLTRTSGSRYCGRWRGCAAQSQISTIHQHVHRKGTQNSNILGVFAQDGPAFTRWCSPEIVPGNSCQPWNNTLLPSHWKLMIRRLCFGHVRYCVREKVPHKHVWVSSLA